MTNTVESPEPPRSNWDVFRNRKHWMAFVVALLCSLATAGNAWAVGPFFEDFEGETNCSTTCTTACPLGPSGFTNVVGEATQGVRDWRVNDGPTGSSNTGPSADHTLGTTVSKYLYLETSARCDAGTYEAHLLSPVLDIAGMTAPTARFWYHMYGASIGELHVDVLDATEALLQADVIPPIVGDQGDQWFQTPNIDLTPWLAQAQVIVRIRGVHNGPVNGNFGYEADQALDDFEFLDNAAPNVRLASIDAPVSACGAGAAEAVTITVENLSGLPANNIQVSYAINGGTPVSEVIAGPLASQATIQHTFATSANLSATGSYDIQVTATVAGDANTGNDNLGLQLSNAAYVAPFNDDFEGASASSFWFVGGQDADFQLGTPSQTVINAAASGVNAWMTNLTGDYVANTDQFVQMACPIDLSSMTDPLLRLNVWWEAEFSFDGGQVQYSLDDGASWVDVGALNSPDGFNWYNDGTISGLSPGSQDGWSGRTSTSNGSNGWVDAFHSLSSIAGEASVLFRVRFGADGSGQDEGFAFDDFSIVESSSLSPEVIFTQRPSPAPTIGGYHTSHPPFAALTLDLQSIGANDLTSLTITNTGTIMDADVLWHLFLDDGDGDFDIATDTQLANMVAQTAGQATLTTGGLPLASLGTERLFVVAEVQSTAMAGDTIIADVAMAADAVFAGTPVVSGLPTAGDTLALVGLVNTYPFEDDFSTFNPFLAGYERAGTILQTATAVGPVGTPNTYVNDAQILLIPSAGALTPVNGTNFLQMDYPNSTAGGAFQYAFDLSAYAIANNDHIWLQFRWSQIEDEDDVEENVFLSLDGGATYLASVHHFDMGTSTNNVWNEQVVDLYGEIDTAALDYTDNVVLRWQGQDDSAATVDGFYVDYVKVGLGPTTALERDMAVYLDGDMDSIGTLPAITQTLTYNVTNGGDFDLVLDPGGFVTANDSSVANVVITQPANLTIPPGMMETVSVQFDPMVGAFSFDLTVPTNGPDVNGDNFTITIDGTGETPANEILVERPAGTEIASGSTDSQGNQMVAMQQELTYTITNTGNIDLNLAGVTVLNQSNCQAGVSVAPMGVVGPQESTTFAVQYTPDAAGAFSFDINIANDDTDENPYIITVDGTGEEMGGVGGGGPSTTTGAGGGATSGAGGSGGDDPPAEEDGGCSCSTPGNQSDDSPLALLAMAGLALSVGRRRRRR